MDPLSKQTDVQSSSGNFTLFSALPTELRQQIWLAALRQSLNPSIAASSNDTILSGDLAKYRPSNEFLQRERKNRAALYTYKPGLWIPEYLPKEDPEYHPDNYINLRFRYDLLDDGHFDVGSGGVVALMETCHESRDVIMTNRCLEEVGLELRPAVCELAYHHGSRNWYELGGIDRFAMGVDEEGEERMRVVWGQLGSDIEYIIGRNRGNDGWSSACEVKGSSTGDHEAYAMSSIAGDGQVYRAALVKMKQYHCHLGRERRECHCQRHVVQEPSHRATIGIDHHNGNPLVLTRKFNPETDLLFFPACAYHVLMIEKSERGFFADLIERGMTTGGDFDRVKHIAISERIFHCGLINVSIVAFAQTFSCLESLSIVVDGFVDGNESARSTDPAYGVNGLEMMAMSNAWRGLEREASTSNNQTRRLEDPPGSPPPAQTCIWRRRQRWEIETIAIFPGKSRGDYSYPTNGIEWHNETIADHLFAQRHGISDPGYHPPVWQATHKIEGLRNMFEQLGSNLTSEMENFILESTQLINFEVRIARAFQA